MEVERVRFADERGAANGLVAEPVADAVHGLIQARPLSLSLSKKPSCRPLARLVARTPISRTLAPRLIAAVSKAAAA